MLEKNRTVNEYSGATRGRMIAEARQMAKRANEQAIAAAHRRPSAAEPSVSIDRKITQDGKINIGG